MHRIPRYCIINGFWSRDKAVIQARLVDTHQIRYTTSTTIPAKRHGKDSKSSTRPVRTTARSRTSGPIVSVYASSAARLPYKTISNLPAPYALMLDLVSQGQAHGNGAFGAQLAVLFVLVETGLSTRTDARPTRPMVSLVPAGTSSRRRDAMAMHGCPENVSIA